MSDQQTAATQLACAACGSPAAKRSSSLLPSQTVIKAITEGKPLPAPSLVDIFKQPQKEYERCSSVYSEEPMSAHIEGLLKEVETRRYFEDLVEHVTDRKAPSMS